MVIGMLLKMLPERKASVPKVKISPCWRICAVFFMNSEVSKASTNIDIERRKGMISRGSFLREFTIVLRPLFLIRE